MKVRVLVPPHNFYYYGRRYYFMIFYCDNKRHLVCKPYSIENLHTMAVQLNIKRCWFHKNHYDIPKTRIEEITAKCVLVDSRTIVKIINKKND